jgi:hypothetical protein
MVFFENLLACCMFSCYHQSSCANMHTHLLKIKYLHAVIAIMFMYRVHTYIVYMYSFMHACTHTRACAVLGDDETARYPPRHTHTCTHTQHTHTNPFQTKRQITVLSDGERPNIALSNDEDSTELLQPTRACMHKYMYFKPYIMATYIHSHLHTYI